MKTKSAILVLALAASMPGLALMQSPDLTREEAAALTYMRQEEKVAQDVYVRLGQRWGGQPFSNIARAEAQHMSAIGGLLKQFGVDDPIANLKEGDFKDAEFKTMFTSLVERGSKSRVEALMVGAQIEEMDLADLGKRLAITKNASIRTVFENLARGSRNHLRAFAGALKRSGGSYKATYMTQQEFDRIANSPRERGGG